MQHLKTKFLAAGSGLTLAAIIALHASPVRAEKNENSVLPVDKPAAKQETVLQPAVAAQGMRVYRDPQTGRIGPPPVGVEPPGFSIAEQHMLNRSDEGLRQRTLPGGAVAVDLQGRYQSMAVATVGADGQAAVNCVHTPEQAHAVLQEGEQDWPGSTD